MGRVIVVGGGAAGMMAAYAAAANGHETQLLEKNEKLGKKLFITGKGRCNVTNACEVKELFDNVVNNPKFLYSAFYAYDNTQVMRFFENAGCPLKTERGERVFPKSDHSSDIIKALRAMLEKTGVIVRLNTEVKRLLFSEDGEENRRIKGVRLSGGQTISADAVIVATGGISYPTTGSTGDGYRFAEDAGLSLAPRKPSLVSLQVRERFCAELAGLSLKNVSVSLLLGKKELYDGFGEMLFTHHGVSGPLILSASAMYAKEAFGQEARLVIDLKPALSEEQLDRRLLRDFEENANRQFKNALGGLFPAALIPVMIRESGIPPEKKVNEITRQERRSFVEKIKHFELTVTRQGDFSEAVITMGGVCVKEINPSTMEAKKIKGLYFAGEVLDVDAMTGGFNLQIAWSTGHLAGDSIK